jgi:hypothetical protein
MDASATPIMKTTCIPTNDSNYYITFPMIEGVYE